MYPSMHWAGGRLSARGCVPRGVCQEGVSAQGVFVSQHALDREGVCIPACTGQGGGCLPGVSAKKGCLPRGVCVSQHALRQKPSVN